MAGLPSPTPSPPNLDAPDAPQTKKRQRSASMHSAGVPVSPPRRAPSQGLDRDSPPHEFVQAHLDEASRRIEGLFARGPLDDVPNDVLSYPPSPGPDDLQRGPMWQDVPATQKSLTAQTLMKGQMQAGDTWYLVSARWMKRWRKAVDGTEDKEGPVKEHDLGPIDNSDLLDESGNLVAPLVEGENVEYVSKTLWDMFVAWYGESQHPLPRKVRKIGKNETALELRPPHFPVLMLVNESDPSIVGPPPAVVTMSCDSTVQELIAEVTRVAAPDLPAGTPSRVWSLQQPRTQIEGSQYPVSRLLQVGGELIMIDEYTQADTLEYALLGPKVFALEVQTDGAWLVDAAAVPGAPPGLEPENPPAPLFSSKNDFFSKMQNDAMKVIRDVVVRASSPSSALKPAPAIKLAGSSKARVPGTLGLGNMGNTCFMNSALQCLAHTPELADYFLTGVYKDELNPDNPLGMQGAIAEGFGSLLNRIWAATGASSSYSPREFKQALARFAPQFSGYQQHDSQELVAFLLDGLHEDLNRILKKPYVEKPDWEGGAEREMVELARKSWEGYLQRNDSVIVDLFQGQYRSTLVCPECQKVSITFDPFMYLTLPLPVKQKFKATVHYIPYDPTKPPVQVPIIVPKDAGFKEVRTQVGRWLEVDPNNLVTMEIFSHRFYKSLDDNVIAGEMNETDTVICYELPTHSQQNRSYKKQPDDPFIIPVYLTDTPTRSTYGRSSTQLFGLPFYVVIDREQAKSLEAIRLAVTDQLQRWTPNARDLYTWRADDDLDGEEMEEVTIPLAGPPAVEMVTEIKENGDIVNVPETVGEDDIADAKGMIIEDAETPMAIDDSPPRKVGPKANVFALNLAPESKKANTGYYSGMYPTYTSWDDRQAAAEGGPLLTDGDSFYLEFDENMRDYYFGGRDARPLWEPKRWAKFEHPEYVALRAQAGEQKGRGMHLQECLDEFVREEELGVDDPWYCPRCKKHQQATKKFDLWRAPDVLVVHLKRFSSSRAMRDKIDTLVDFPIEGLDLEPMIEERKVAKVLREQGVDIDELGMQDLEDPLVYDLFAVDEHLGGLGGGHYRAYALNHVTDKWYHFDDSFVTESRATEAVNSNAYLLFYRRRTARPLGGKTHEKVEAARQRAPPPAVAATATAAEDMQLPTPPDEGFARGRRSPAGSDSSRGSILHGFLRGLGSSNGLLRLRRGSSAGSDAPGVDASGLFDGEDEPPELHSSEYFDYTSRSRASSPSVDGPDVFGPRVPPRVQFDDYDAPAPPPVYSEPVPVVEIPVEESTLDDIE